MFNNIEKSIAAVEKSVESNRKEHAAVVTRIRAWTHDTHPTAHGLEKLLSDLNLVEFRMHGYSQRIAALKCLRGDEVLSEGESWWQSASARAINKVLGLTGSKDRTNQGCWESLTVSQKIMISKHASALVNA